MTSHKTIAKNTMFLYVRMFLIMGITLYSSRIVLEELGVSDYGIYNLVAGIVSIMGFFNAAMSTATQRYLSFDIGQNDTPKLQKTFSTSIVIHFAIGVLILILAETIGLWYINNKMIFPQERVFAVNVVYQFSILTFFIGIIQVPFNALIIAKERMNIYAYLSFVEAILKLIIVFFLVYIGSDKLITYSVLVFSVTLLIALLYQIYCKKEFPESRFVFQKDKGYYKELISYSSWSLFGNIAVVAKGQGVNLVLNLFFGTVVNAAYGITNQVVSAVNLFATNLQIAFNPQIIKNYSQGNIEQTQNLIFQGSKISFFLILLLVTPILLNTEYILMIWLNDVPEYTVLFVQLSLIGVLIDCISGAFVTAAQATGKIKWYQIVIGTLLFFNLPISYFMLKIGLSAYSVFILSITISFVSLQFRVLFLKKMMNIDIKKYYSVIFLRIIIISLIVFIGAVLYKYYINVPTIFLLFIVESLLILLSVIGLILLFGINSEERKFIIEIIQKKIKR